MKYYHYVSDTKIDMLAGQIDPRLWQRTARELKIDLKVVSLTLSDNPREDTRYSKLRMVTRCLESEEEIGTIATPAKWFQGSAPLAWGLVGKNAGVTYFTNVVDGVLLGLTGSSDHLIGGKGGWNDAGSSWVDLDKERYAPGGSSLRGVTEMWLSGELDVSRSDAIETEREQILSESAVDAMLFIHRRLRGHAEQLEFVAKKLLDLPSSAINPRGDRDLTLEGKIPPFDRVLLGTPLYVAMDD